MVPNSAAASVHISPSRTTFDLRLFCYANLNQAVSCNATFLHQIGVRIGRFLRLGRGSSMISLRRWNPGASETVSSPRSSRAVRFCQRVRKPRSLSEPATDTSHRFAFTLSQLREAGREREAAEAERSGAPKWNQMTAARWGTLSSAPRATKEIFLRSFLSSRARLPSRRASVFRETSAQRFVPSVSFSSSRIASWFKRLAGT